MGTKGRLPKSVRVLLGIIALVATWCGVTWPVFNGWLKTPVKDRADFFREQLWAVPSPLTGEVPVAGYLFVMTCVAVAIYVLWFISRILRYLENSWVPISVLEVDITLSFNGPDMKTGIVHRVQWLHANRSDVQAYPFSLSADAAAGKIDQKSLKVSSLVGSNDVQDDLLIQGTGTRLNVIEMFKTPLKPSFLASLMPNNWVLKKHKDYGWFTENVVKRDSSVSFQNEYNGDEAGYSVFASRFPVSNVTLTIVFPEETAPDHLDVRGFVIRENAARRLPSVPQPKGKTVSYEWKVREFKQSELRVWWTNDRLKAWEQKRRQSAQRRKTARAR